MPGTLDTRIQIATKTYRDATVAGMDESTVRSTAETLGIDGSETTPLVTLREAIVQHYRNRLRKNGYVTPVTGTVTGYNPGHDNVALSDA